MSLLEKTGQDPQRSMQRFFSGLGLFIIGACFIFFGYYQHYLWQMLGMVILACGCLLAIYGYIGLFANRLYHIFNRTKP
ncbi:MAG: putative MFS family arabinose efflux permease [Cognaticolwellia sp.]|jgi:predicted MFS family arabinose efflux permease